MKSGFVTGLIIGGGASLLPHLGDNAPAHIVEMVEVNLGSSVYLFAGTLALFIWWTTALRKRLDSETAKVSDIASLNARVNMLPNACITIGMIFTILGMASGIQNFVIAVANGADNPLKVLVDKGALIALMSTAVGLGGAWLLRLFIEMLVGSKLHERQQKEEEKKEGRAILPLLEILRDILRELKSQNLLLESVLTRFEQKR